ncbi:MAG TPA: hypothetical protein VIV60_27535 [Polyangiaceae bacterium]
MTLAPIGNRSTKLRDREQEFTGIAFVHVTRPANEYWAAPCLPFTLRVYFLTNFDELTYPFRDVGGLAANVVPLTLSAIVLREADGDPNVPDVPALPASSVEDIVYGSDPETCLSYIEFKANGPNDFRKYRIRIEDPFVKDARNTSKLSRLDPFFNDVEFTFEVGCEDTLDCAPRDQACPNEPTVDFPVDYLARDYVSLKNALLDFASHRYPEWTYPIEADVGMVMTEILAAMGDEFSYIQDRYAREAYLETATERRTLRKKARLLDYDIHDGRNATTLLDVRVKGGSASGVQSIAVGTQVWAMTEGAAPVVFEVGLGLRDSNQSYPVSFDWNAEQLPPYWPDVSRKCLQVGATELLIGTALADAALIRSGLESGDRLMLLRTDPKDASVPSRRHFVHVTGISIERDPLADEANGQFTRITWDKSDALPFQIDQSMLELSLNIVPATAGETREELGFVCHPTSVPTSLDVEPTPTAVEREGYLPVTLDPQNPPTRPTVYLFSLPDTETGGLGFLGPSLREARPEIVLKDPTGIEWQYTRSLLEADATHEAYALEDGTWRRVVGYRRLGDELVHHDYASGHGYTLRFGDGVFGRTPPDGTQFSVTYRLNPGAQANVPADTIVDGRQLTTRPKAAMPDFVASVTNPWPVKDGVDPETASDIKLYTPEAYKADVYFAVTPEDYGEQTARLDFVQRGYARLRWTGSWNTVFASADPYDSYSLTDDQFAAVEGWLDCVRQAGRDVIVKEPRFRTLDLEIHVCVESYAYAGQVARLVTEALLGRGGTRPLKGFFNPDNFTFGTPLRRSALEAAVQKVAGVRAVLLIRLRSRGRYIFDDFTELTLDVDADEVIRLENDPTHPERGSLRIITEGGA